MDNEMIERVATDELAIARAAIKAMREPTEKMLKTEGIYCNCYTCGGHKEGWQKMIDAIINE